jgi:hypothetical protein
MTDDLKKIKWIERVEKTAHYHKERLKANSLHTLANTSKELNRSIGCISEDLMIYEWLKTHRKYLERLRSMREALEFVRERKKIMRVM